MGVGVSTIGVGTCGLTGIAIPRCVGVSTIGVESGGLTGSDVLSGVDVSTIGLVTNTLDSGVFVPSLLVGVFDLSANNALFFISFVSPCFGPLLSQVRLKENWSMLRLMWVLVARYSCNCVLLLNLLPLGEVMYTSYLPPFFLGTTFLLHPVGREGSQYMIKLVMSLL